MKEFLEYLAEKKAGYYYNLYLSKKRAERKEEHLQKVQMMDEYALLLDVIDRLPFESKKEVDAFYKEQLDRLKILNS